MRIEGQVRKSLLQAQFHAPLRSALPSPIPPITSDLEVRVMETSPVEGHAIGGFLHAAKLDECVGSLAFGLAAHPGGAGGLEVADDRAQREWMQRAGKRRQIQTAMANIGGTAACKPSIDVKAPAKRQTHRVELAADDWKARRGTSSSLHHRAVDIFSKIALCHVGAPAGGGRRGLSLLQACNTTPEYLQMQNMPAGSPPCSISTHRSPM